MHQPELQSSPTDFATATAGSDHRLRVLVISACSAVLLLTYARIYFGVDLDDEAFHVAVPYRYALGARPFVDEVHISQIGAGLVAYPFVAAYHSLIGLDGIVLFLRHIYLLSSLAFATALFFSLRVMVRLPLLVLPTSLLVVAFIPHNRPSLSYNSLGNGLFTAGCFFGLAYLTSRRQRYIFLAGATHGLAIFCYPPLALPIAVCAGAYFLLAGRSLRGVAPYVATVALGVIGWLLVLLNDGIGTAREAFEVASAIAEGRDRGIDRGVTVLRDAAANFALAPLAVAVIAGAIVVRDRRPRLAVGLLAIVPLLAVPARPVDLALPGASIHFVANLGVLGLPFLYLLRDLPLSRLLFVGVWIPGFVAGVTFSWSTFDPGGHQGLGFFAAAIATVVLLALSINRILEHEQKRVSSYAPLLPVLAALAALIGLQYASASHDGSPLTLTSRIDRGAYAGLMTRPTNARFLRSLTRDLEPIVHPECTTLFFYGLPAGYLLVSATPSTNTAFLTDREPLKTEYGRRLLDYYAEQRALPDVVVQLIRIPYLVGTGRPRYQSDDQIEGLLQSARYRSTVATASYRIFTLLSGACAST